MKSFTAALFLLVALLTVNAFDPIGPSLAPAAITATTSAKLDGLVNEMKARWQALDANCDPDSAFALLYIWMTNTSAAYVNSGYFDDGNQMANFMDIFAHRYLNGFDTYHVNHSTPTGPWQEAYSYSDSGYSSVFENLMQGINAHINFDLGIVVYNLSYVSASQKKDYDRINDILEYVAPFALGDIAQRYDPSLSSPVFSATGPIVNAALFAEREAAWQNGNFLLNLPFNFQRQLHLKGMEIATTAAAIALEGNRLGLTGSTTADRVAYCSTHH
eukprot:TRINITY_DN14981_c0_g1_i1.p2 TRINITY_DN14981_c0_g1~~TRINITY_DN14981_c0_g1_i1.p2  ORF type:complete len:274 (+),score=61.16 TRINITY_DN14981_c0_g1_i1:123-944(+)